MGPENDIGWAVQRLHSGEKVSRRGWNGKGMFLFIPEGWAFTDRREDNFQSSKIVVMRVVDGGYIPWLCSQADLLATDWYGKRRREAEKAEVDNGGN